MTKDEWRAVIDVIQPYCGADGRIDGHKLIGDLRRLTDAKRLLRYVTEDSNARHLLSEGFKQDVAAFLEQPELT